MAHQSEAAVRLAINRATEFPQSAEMKAGVWAFLLPFGRRIDIVDRLTAFAENADRSSLVVVLAPPFEAAEIVSALRNVLKFQLWIAVKLADPIPRGHGQLPHHHVALLVFSKYRTSLKHTKTRIAYSFCPACDKTTKDYGGKKHTYHEYGTLMSDVWRDISFTPGEWPEEILSRLADLFGLEPHRELQVVDLQSAPTPCWRVTEVRPNEKGILSTPMKSQLITGDSLVELAKLPANSVDFCFADPPYNIAKRYDKWDDGIDIQEYFAWCDRWLDQLVRVLRPGCTCAVLNIPLWAVRHFEHLKKALNFQAWIAWEGLSLPVRMIMPAHYAIVCFSKGLPRPLPGIEENTTLKEDYCLRLSCKRPRGTDMQPLSDLWWDIHRLKHNSRRVDHPCQLPPALMTRLITLFSNENELVLDPFNGAGTTSLCAELLGRRYIGIELSTDYHALAVSRHEALARGEDPFAKAKRVPKAKNSRVARIGGVRYNVAKKQLQLEVKRIAKELGRMPTRDDIEKYSQFPLKYYDEYFINWGEVCAAARTTGMTETRLPPKSPEGRQPLLFQD